MTRKTIYVIILVLAVILWSMILLNYAATGKAMTGICVVTKGEWVWLRDQPNPDAEKIGTIRYGTDVEISTIENQYAHVQWNGQEGWADVSYFLIPQDETVYNITCEGDLNKRETPDGRFLTKIKGKRISVLGWRYSKKGELWAYVYHGGYVDARYLSKE